MSAELKATCLYSALIAQYSALQLSAGQLFELMLPVSFALTVILSAWVLASARRLRFSAASITLWTLGTLFFPFVIMPLYLIARSVKGRRGRERASDEVQKQPYKTPLRRTLPLAYLVVMLALGALYFYMDWQSVDAHLARANQARVQGQSARIIEEYRAALKLEDDAHTHNLLAKEYWTAGRFDEALAEFRTAERMGEDDEELYFNIGTSLDKLNRTVEAKPEYEKFLQGSLCAEIPHDARCVAVRARVNELARGKTH